MKRKIYKTILTIVACASFVMMMAEADSMGVQILCTGSAMLAFALSCRALTRGGYLDDDNNA